jgi:hypothetical protein
MLTTLNTDQFLAEATSIASVQPGWQSFDVKFDAGRRSGYVPALAARLAH